MSSKATQPISFRVEVGDARSFVADVLVLKYAQSSYGLDAVVLNLLSLQRSDLQQEMPADGEEVLVDSNGKLGCPSVLFAGVAPLFEFGYEEIRSFGRRVLQSLASLAPHAKHVCLTIHGPGYGLDEAEAFKAQLAGLLDAIATGLCPSGLSTISFVERDSRRAERLDRILQLILPDAGLVPESPGAPKGVVQETAETLQSVGAGSSAKRHVFVAMPFAEEMSDIFHYGIEPAVKTVAPLCERADQAIFTGEIMAWVKDRIRSATLMVADLTGANANVYLEVGYAWGCGVPTVLLTRDTGDLKFDVKAHRCIVYKSILDLETRLSKELAGLFP